MSFPATKQSPRLTVDIVIFCLRKGELQTLLVKRGIEPFRNCWALPGGFVLYNESPDAAAQRELAEEAGITHVYLEQLYTFGAPERDPRGHVVTVAYYALIPSTDVYIQAGSDALDAAWYAVQTPPPLAFDHAHILQYAVQRLRYKLEYTAAGFHLLPDEFTLSELQTAYEIVLNEKLDKRNFRRKLAESGVLVATDRYRSGSEGRPALLYRYREDADPEVKARRLFP
jgi:8-oxo-dGTP diphosphatase